MYFYCIADAPPGSLAALLEEENFDYETTSNALWEEELVRCFGQRYAHHFC